MKTTKRIIIRIIVAVAVAFILSKFKLLGIMQVNALQNTTGPNTDFCVYIPTSPTCDTTLTTSQIWNRQFKTYRYYGSVNIQAVSALFTFGNSYNNKPVYLTGAFYFTGNIDFGTNALRAYVDTTTGSPFACDIVPMVDFNDGGKGYLATIKCDKVITTNGNFRLFVHGPFANYDSAYGFSLFNIVYDNDELLAQQQANSYINDLKNSITSTNSKLDILIELQRQENNTQQQIQNNTKETNDLIKSDNTDDANSKGSNFFNNFQGNSHGLSGILTAPLRLLNSLTTQGCSPLEFDLPFVNKHVSLPCMRGIYEQHFGIFFSLWQMITTGLISYNVILNLYSKVRQMQNPNNDRIEVLNL